MHPLLTTDPGALFTWRTMRDARVCVPCAALDGRVLGAKELRLARPPFHPRCRCWLEPMPPEEAKRLSPFAKIALALAAAEAIRTAYKLIDLALPDDDDDEPDEEERRNSGANPP